MQSSTAAGNHPFTTTQWLVSVRDLAEARVAMEFGVDILDWKEPDRGALAPVSIEVLHDAANWFLDSEFSRCRTGGKTRMSAALGERDSAIDLASQIPTAFSFAKVGASDCATVPGLRQLWNQVSRRLPPSIQLVPVAYADPSSAGACDPELVFQTAAESGYRRVLIDTFEKGSGGSVGLLGIERLARLGELARNAGMWWSIAGSLTLTDWLAIDARLDHEQGKPDCVGVRGDICESSRRGRLCPNRMDAWAQSIAKTPRRIKPSPAR